jgi:hypothetical protein
MDEQRDLAADMFAMNDLSESIIAEPMGSALAPTNPSREQNGRLIQDARIAQGTDPGMRRRLIEVARSTISESVTASEHETLLLDTFTRAALLGASLEVGRIVESMGDPRFCRWLATTNFRESGS